MPEKMLSESQSQVPYQAYKSKRHSRNFSNPSQPPNGLLNNITTPPKPRPSSFMGTPSSLGPVDLGITEKHGTFAESKELQTPDRANGFRTRAGSPPIQSTPETLAAHSTEVYASSNSILITSEPKTEKLDIIQPSLPPEVLPPAQDISPSLPPSRAHRSPVIATVPLPTPPSQPSLPPNEALATSSAAASKPPSPQASPRRASTFRHVPLRRSPLPSSPLRPSGTPQSTFRTLSPMATSSRLPPDQSIDAPSHSKPVTPDSVETLPPIPAEEESTTIASISRPTALHAQPSHHVRSTSDATLPVVPPPRASSLQQPSTTPPPTGLQSRASSSSTPISSAPTSPRPGTSSSLPSRTQAPYRPGFQPRGVYRPRTEEFIELRREAHNSGSLRIERTKLERRLEKLIALHFPEGDEQHDKTHRPSGTHRRASSFFDLDISDLKSIDPGGLWKSMMMQGTASSGKGDVRAAEQRITPWEDDSAVNKCPLCSASFHPLTNRKHHCRLCGKIICALPVKHPQRPVTCSLLFVVDKKTRVIEEVSEGVDYGVRKRRVSTIDPKSGKGSHAQDDADEKFLKGVRICRTCRPIISRQQFLQETTVVPPFVRLYEVFVTLEKEIEASLPQFEELLLSLTTDDHPTKEAAAARKRLLEAFAQYDALSKRIRQLPCPSGPGSSQDRVQSAVTTRANLFLQKHMFPLQTIPKKSSKQSSSSPSPSPSAAPAIDPDSQLALALQPLLEQEALLESFIVEANAHRKFEDVKTLQTNLREIRREIDRIVANSGDRPR